MGINPNELIIDRVRELIFTSLEDGSVIGRLTQLEDSSLNTSAEGEDVVNAVGSVITTLYRSKAATFSATNSLFSLDLAAQQFGTDKEVATETETISVPASEVLEIVDGKITLSNTPNGEIKYIYRLENKNLAERYELGTEVSENEFTITDGVITVPTGVEGKIYVEYEYDGVSAVKIANKADNFSEAVGVKIFCIFKNICNENQKYAGSIVAKKGKLDPTSVELGLTSTGKHPFTVNFNEDYCDDVDADLFSIIVAE